MARGWESKSVEAQQEAAARPRSTQPPPSPAEAAARAEHAVLALARAHVWADLERASAPAHRTMLEHAIAELDRRIAALDVEPFPGRHV